MSRLAAGLATVVMTVFGATGFASAATITTTGPSSTNVVNTSVNTNCSTANENSLHYRSANYQAADTGNASVSHNTTAGTADSGDAINSNNTHAAAVVRNASNDQACACVPAANTTSSDATIAATGPDSKNSITNAEVTNNNVTNTNDVTATSINSQAAVTGSATATNNTFGGSAATGNASNIDTANFLVDIQNSGVLTTPSANCGSGNRNDAPTTGRGISMLGGGFGRGSSLPQSSSHEMNRYVNRGSGFSPSQIGFQGANRIFSSPAATQQPGQPAMVQPQPQTAAGQVISSEAPQAAPVRAEAAPSSAIVSTGPGSNNSTNTSLNSSSTTTNTNNVVVTSSNYQTAFSGPAAITVNANSGSATTGAGTNEANAGMTAAIVN